ncbi:MAG TPA: acetate CoA-transferase subunit alpha [Symbiobacteriaceae bacterium]|nr:acetate CoA-transferase subunit alpha [Symbiobacteriaceae bacterium]
MSKVTTLQQAMNLIQDGMTIMVGGFMAVGTPELFMDALVEKGTKDLTIICNDAGLPDKGVGKLIAHRQVKRLIASHIGLNPEAGKLMNTGEMAVDLVPQGTLAERIRCGGAGIGGFLTPTGVGTVVEEGKQKLTIDGKEYLLELPLKANVSLVFAHQADTMGNLVYRRSIRNFNPPMAMAAETTIALVREVVEAGQIDPDLIVTPGIVVDHVVSL